MPVERVMGPHQSNMKNYRDLQPIAQNMKHRLSAPGEKIFLLTSFPDCFLALSVILVERFQLPNPAFRAGVHAALEGVHHSPL